MTSEVAEPHNREYCSRSSSPSLVAAPEVSNVPGLTIAATVVGADLVVEGTTSLSEGVILEVHVWHEDAEAIGLRKCMTHS